ncbi:hypothetical protein HA402_014303 [Bradysia odoriphaga]|nr:hypothetical protein HA402_014303 [Bradysia odoriphaga]
MLRKFIVAVPVFAFISAIVFTEPIIQNNQSADTRARVVKFKNQSNRTGIYSVIYELSNGIFHYEDGTLNDDNHNRVEDIVEGTYWFVGPDNRTYKIEYIVSEDDFTPQIGDGSGVSNNLLRSLVG